MNEPWVPKLIQGGKSDDIEDWLWDLPRNTVFLCTNNMGHLLDLWLVVFKKEEGLNTAVRLEHPEHPDLFAFVDSKIFSRKFRLFMVLSGVTDGSNNSVEQERLVGLDRGEASDQSL